MIAAPRAPRIIFWGRLRMPWRLPAWLIMTLPEPERRKRFLAPDLFFSLGILHPFRTKRDIWSGWACPFAGPLTRERGVIAARPGDCKRGRGLAERLKTGRTPPQIQPSLGASLRPDPAVGR